MRLNFWFCSSKLHRCLAAEGCNVLTDFVRTAPRPTRISGSGSSS